ncbi:MAG: LPS export ABC transporter periplasmic protein LptC [Bauldia sp.]|nr:LPS export ABC transporter periplasmic protein LptC [Bauldia sp.]
MSSVQDQLRLDRRDRLDVTAVRGEQAFAAARRHGRIVRVLRWALPLVVILAAGGFLAFLYLPKQIGPVTIGKIDLEQNSLVMETPRISGFHGNEQTYEVSASRAVQRLDDPTKVRLDDLQGTIGLAEDNTATVSAGTGLYDTAAEVLTLSGGIAINTTQGYEAHLEEATIDFAAETMRSDRPVSLITPDGTISGEAVEISDGGHRILVTGSVKVTLYPQGMPTLRGTDVADARIPVAP